MTRRSSGSRWPSRSGSSCCSSGTRPGSSGTWCGGWARTRPTTSSRKTFLLAFRQRAGFDVTRGDALPWLYGIATNLLGRHRRNEIRLYKALARTGTDPVTAPFTDQVDERVTATAASRRLASALAGLSAAYREALLLVAWGGLSYEETATALDVPVGTVRSRISRARADLRRTLGDLAPASTEETR
jgi:RNA polymerase sigma factor (sigma-70 family)